MWETHDDDVGGAMVSGTLMNPSDALFARVEQVPVQHILYAQGFETERMWDLTTQPFASGILERDEIELVWPPEHYLLNSRLRVVALTSDSLSNDRRRHVEAVLKRITRSRTTP
jgi:hypothetical protein